MSKDIPVREVTDTSPFISVYMPIAGWKAIMYTWADEYGGYWEPEETGSFAYATKAEAIQDAYAWAMAEGLPFRDTDPEDTDDAPNKSVTEQLQELIPGLKVVTLK